MAIHAWGTPLSSGLLWAGWVLGGMCAYLLGRTVGRPVLRRLTSTAALARFENRISMQASFGLVLLFQLAVPSEVPGYVLGLARYRFVKYLLVVGIMLANYRTLQSPRPERSIWAPAFSSDV